MTEWRATWALGVCFGASVIAAIDDPRMWLQVSLWAVTAAFDYLSNKERKGR